MRNKRLIVVIIVVSVIITVILGYVNIVKNNKNNNKAGIEIITEKEEIKAIDEEVDTSKWDLNKVKIEYDTENVPVPVPIGFTASKAEGEHTVNTGFVIYEGEITETEVANENEWTEEEAWQLSLDRNQFVWVPVKNASERIYEAS